MGDRNHRSGNINGPVQMGDGVQFNAGRDQFVAYRDQYVAGRDQVVHDRETREVIAELACLRQALKELRLTSGERDRAERELTAIEGAMDSREPDTTAVEGHLQSFTAGLKEAGALASAGTSLAMSIGTIAHWLGPLGAAVIALL
jgi:hypothetical protein